MKNVVDDIHYVRVLLALGLELDFSCQGQTGWRFEKSAADRYFQSEIPVGFGRQQEPQRNP